MPDIALQRMRNERLVGTPFSNPEDVVAWLCAVQAQDYPAAKWGIGQRVKDCTDADVDAAFQKGLFVRTHVMRPTWHFVLPQDVRWLQALTSGRVKAQMAHYDRQLEVDAATFRRSNAAIADALAGNQHLTRPEIGKHLETAEIVASGQRLGHLLMRAELDALICSGPMRGKQHTYALVEERAPGSRALDREESLAELAKRYFISHGPALVQDFAWWSGLTVADARRGLDLAKSDLAFEAIGGQEYWTGSTSSSMHSRKPLVHLLPNYDECLIAYKDYAPSLDPRLDAAGTRGFLYDALSRHIVTLDGKVAGGWRRTIAKQRVNVETKLLVPFTDSQHSALSAAAERYGRFLGMPVDVVPGDW
jgi:hypothetical protein